MDEDSSYEYSVFSDRDLRQMHDIGMSFCWDCGHPIDRDVQRCPDCRNMTLRGLFAESNQAKWKAKKRESTQGWIVGIIIWVGYLDVRLVN
jgi:hypothetical protein